MFEIVCFPKKLLTGRDLRKACCVAFSDFSRGLSRFWPHLSRKRKVSMLHAHHSLSGLFFSEISLSHCQKQLQEAINLPPDPDRFVPRCKFDGSFEEVQCRNSTGLCWCVDRDGNELSSTTTNLTVTCPNIGKIFIRYIFIRFIYIFVYLCS